MKLQTTFMLLLVVALVFAAIGEIVKDFKTYYPEAGDVDTSWETQYSYASNISLDILDIKTDLKNIAAEEAGWKRILGGLLVFVKASITAVLAILLTPGYIITIITSILTGFQIPMSIIIILDLMITMSVVFYLIKFLSRSPI